MQERTLEYIRLGRLKAHPNNVRTHPNKQIERLAEGIKQYGFTNPVLTDENYTVLAGHGRVAAARLTGLKKVPCVVLRGLTDAQKRAYLLFDNKLAEQAGYEREALATELNELVPLLAEAGLSVDLTGFDPAEIDALLCDYVDPEHDPGDDVPMAIARKAITRRGDLWLLGDHRLVCGDACSATDVARLMKRQRAAMVCTDPPYNVKIKGVQGRGKTKHREFVKASGEMSPKQFVKFLSLALGLAAQHSAAGSIHFVFMDWRHAGELLAAGAKVYSELKNIIVWVKTNAGQGSFYRSQHEFIFVYKSGEGTHINTFGLGQKGRSRSNVWTYAGANSFKAGRMDELAMHPTVKPVALISDAMRDCSHRGDIILDPFMGSGTTILAAERVGRRAYGLELDPLYVDVAIRRWQAFTKSDAILERTGQTFDAVAAGEPATKRRARA